MRKFLSAVLTLAVLAGAASAADIKKTVEGPTKVKPYSLVRIKAEGLDAKAGVIWRVNPSNAVSRATTPRGLLEFVAPPGVYTVELLVIRTNADGAIEIEEQFTTVEIEKCCDKVPPIPDTPKPQPEPEKPPEKKPDPLNALGRIQFTNAGCTATVVWPRRADGKWDMLTAAHCVRHVGVGAVGTCQLRTGEKFKVKVLNLDETSDCAWLVTESADLGDLPFAKLADKNPAAGVKVWHAGYGVDVPGNREDGSVNSDSNSEGQTEFTLSVSSGDSGGGIFRTDTGELVSTVCCTTAKGRTARVWGASAEVCGKRRPKPTAADDAHDWFRPIAIPERPVSTGRDVRDWWRPVSIPERDRNETAELWFPLNWKK